MPPKKREKINKPKKKIENLLFDCRHCTDFSTSEAFFKWRFVKVGKKVETFWAVKIEAKMKVVWASEEIAKLFDQSVSYLR